MTDNAFSRGRPAALVFTAVIAATQLGGCIPLVIGGAAMAGGAMVATDRRTSGTQLEDEGIELKASRRVGDLIGDRGHVSVTSYGRVVLISGEVPTDADKANVDREITRIENVRSVVDELTVGPPASLTSRSSDAILTSKVKASFVDAKDLQANAFKVVTERGTVFLMGRVTEREASRAADIARGINGVTRVVRVFEILSEAELANTQPR
jgi:osmotically-inducible protein OsmY